MEIMLRNCQGADEDSTQQVIKDLVRRHQPAILFLSETKIKDKDECRKLCLSLGFDQFAAILSEGQSGGLMLLWRDCINVRFRSNSKYHIDMVADIEEERKPFWSFTGFYGYPMTSERANTWALLRELAENNTLPWLVGGDLNETQDQGEKQGGRVQPMWQMGNTPETLDQGWVDLRLGRPGWVVKIPDDQEVVAADARQDRKLDTLGLWLLGLGCKFWGNAVAKEVGGPPVVSRA